jgi:hypothetical protein
MLGSGRKEKVKSTACSSARASGAERWGGSTGKNGWYLLELMSPRTAGERRDRKRRRKQRAEMMRQKEVQAAEARARSAAASSRRKIVDNKKKMFIL